jgi:hypothetical protein
MKNKSVHHVKIRKDPFISTDASEVFFHFYCNQYYALTLMYTFNSHINSYIDTVINIV